MFQSQREDYQTKKVHSSFGYILLTVLNPELAKFSVLLVRNPENTQGN